VCESTSLNRPGCGNQEREKKSSNKVILSRMNYKKNELKKEALSCTCSGSFFPMLAFDWLKRKVGGGCLMSQPVRFSYSEAWNPAELGDSFAGFRTVSLLQDAASSGSPRGFSVSQTV